MLAAALLSGCGTIANVSGGRWRTSHIYGGVLRDVGVENGSVSTSSSAAR